MKYKVTTNTGVDFAPDTEAAEILQNVRTIISTRKGSVPLDREFGISWAMVDKPLPVARSQMQAQVIEAIEKYEPRAKVQSVEFNNDVEGSAEGLLNPIVIISIGEEEEDEDE